ncbi:hypothetical protein CRG98_001595 [Punica granatum]|uniref:Uncharacterized protein n=1 Tax=Punica granatum TaxID=22663 RepID=A0A2I0LBC9_PUNGR|nr:hypothetical protein CRG98_001595 [Punica granatum]
MGHEFHDTIGKGKEHGSRNLYTSDTVALTWTAGGRLSSRAPQPTNNAINRKPEQRRRAARAVSIATMEHSSSSSSSSPTEVTSRGAEVDFD